MANPLLYLHLIKDTLLGFFYILFGRVFPRNKLPPVDLTGKTVIITGANAGIGYSLTVSLARQNATIYLACRSKPKALAAIQKITTLIPSATGRLHFIPFDASLLSSARSLASSWPRTQKIDILIHNAGIGAPTTTDPVYTPEGFPTLYVTNFLSSFLLTKLLEPYLSPSARVILTSSFGSYTSTFSSHFSLSAVHNSVEKGFHTGNDQLNSSYNNSKAMQNIFASLLQARFDRQSSLNEKQQQQQKRIAHAFHPGFVRTEIFDKMPPVSFSKDLPFWALIQTANLLGEDSDSGAMTGVYLATSEDGEVRRGGGFWDRDQRRVWTGDLMSEGTRRRFWRRWEADADVEWNSG